MLSQSAHGKGAEAVARRITQPVVAEGLQPGELVGTEPELIAREGVSRAVFREAVRLLEHHQIARMRRGPGGGLFVFEPSAAAVTEVAAIYLARRGMRLSDLAEVRTGVEVAIAGLAAAAHRRRRARRAMHRRAGPRGEDATDAERATPCTTCMRRSRPRPHNRVLELVALVLIRLSRLYQIERLAPKAREQISAEVLRAHEGIAAAVEAGDRELARTGCAGTSRRSARSCAEPGPAERRPARQAGLRVAGRLGAEKSVLFRSAPGSGLAATGGGPWR